MKKPISFILILCMVLAMMPMMGGTASATVGDTFSAYITVSGAAISCEFKVLTEPDGSTPGTVQIGDGSNAAVTTNTAVGMINIPDQISSGSATYNVTKIGSRAFSECSELTGALTIPTSVTTIGEHAFYGCSGLTGNLTIPEGVTTIGSRAFVQCSGLTGNLTIPSSVTSIGISAFSGCTSLSALGLTGSALQTIGIYAFFECSGLTGTLTIPSSVTSIGHYAFSSCTSLSALVFTGSALQTIGQYAFNGCSKLTGALTIPSSVTTIGAYAFKNCSGLTGPLTIPAGVTTIEQSAFAYCRGLTGNLTIPAGVTSIGDSAFFYCSGLTGTLTIPASVTTIGASAFYNCSGFTSVELLKNSTPATIGSNAFNSCTSLVRLFVPAAWTGSDTVALRGISTSFAIGTDSYSLVKVAGLTSVLGQTLSSPGGGTGATSETAITWSINVANEVTQVTSGAIEPATSSTAILYSDAGFSANANNAIPLLEGGPTIAYIKATSTAISGDPVTTRYHKVTINRAAANTISTAAIAGVTAPVNGATPVDAIAETDEYTATIAWSPADATFGASTVYTATITITPKTGYTLTGVTENFFTVAGATATNAANAGVVTAVFPETAAAPTSGGGSGGGGAASTLVTKINTGGTVTGTNVDNLVKEGKSLTVDGKSGETLVFDTEALKTINAQTKDTVKVEIKDVSSDYIHVHPGRLVVSLTVTAGDQRITNFGNGTATISLPHDLKEGEKAEDVTVWYLAEDGTMTEVPCTYNPETKLATFQVNHFSLYLVGTADISLWVNPFSDVAETRWYYDAVRYVSANGLMNGTADTAFNPNGKTSRGMIVTILWRMENQPSSEKEMTFTDVKSGKYYWDAVAWASEKGIVSGYSDERFGPEDNITREQLAVILHNYAVSKGIGTESTADLAGFVDSTNIHDWALDAMMWANGEGLINGVGNSKLSPLGSAERCQVAAILQRFILNLAE
jgi:hypothetical protein